MTSKRSGSTDTDESSKSLAVLETELHAGEVIACNAGQDVVEYAYPTLGRAKSVFARGKLLAGRDWESQRPLEVEAATPPVVSFPPDWHAKRGRFCRITGIGQRRLMLLRARRSY